MHIESNNIVTLTLIRKEYNYIRHILQCLAEDRKIYDMDRVGEVLELFIDIEE